MKLFDAASRLLPTMFVVSLTPEGTLYQHANQRLTTVVYMLDEHREKLTNLEMMSHKADYRRWVPLRVRQHKRCNLHRRLKGVADVIEETLKGVSLEGGRALSKKDLKTIVTSFFLEAESFHKRVTVRISDPWIMLPTDDHDLKDNIAGGHVQISPQFFC